MQYTTPGFKLTPEKQHINTMVNLLFLLEIIDEQQQDDMWQGVRIRLPGSYQTFYDIGDSGDWK